MDLVVEAEDYFLGLLGDELLEIEMLDDLEDVLLLLVNEMQGIVERRGDEAALLTLEVEPPEVPPVGVFVDGVDADVYFVAHPVANREQVRPAESGLLVEAQHDLDEVLGVLADSGLLQQGQHFHVDLEQLLLVLVDLIREQQPFRDHLLHHTVQIVLGQIPADLPRHLSVQHEVQTHAQAPHVAFVAVTLASLNLNTVIKRRSHFSRVLLVQTLLLYLAHPEVRYLYHIIMQKNVLRLQVSMNYIVRVQILVSLNYLKEIIQYLVFTQHLSYI